MQDIISEKPINLSILSVIASTYVALYIFDSTCVVCVMCASMRCVLDGLWEGKIPVDPQVY